MNLKKIKDVSYLRLGDETNHLVDGQIPLNKGKEASAAFFKENVEPNTRRSSSAKEKVNFLMKKDFIEAEFIEKYLADFIERLHALLDE